MKTNLIIRNAHEDELDAAALVIRDSYQQYRKDISPAGWEGYVKDMMDVRGRQDKAELIVAELDGKLVGAVTLYPNGSRSEREVWPEAWAGVRLLATLPDCRGHGIGRALMDECIRRSRERGAAAVGLHTTEFMDVGRRMYEKMGFVRAPEFDFYPESGRVVMAYRMDL